MSKSRNFLTDHFFFSVHGLGHLQGLQLLIHTGLHESIVWKWVGVFDSCHIRKTNKLIDLVGFHYGFVS
jgi:hypothetical protein